MVLRGGSLEILVAHVDPLALLVLEGLHDLAVGDGPVLLLADLLVADPASVRLVDVVEVQAAILDGAVHAHRYVDEPEGDRARPDRSGHQAAASSFSGWPGVAARP